LDEASRETLEDTLFSTGERPEKLVQNYEPVMYKVVHRPEDLNMRESIIDIQEGFLMRSERLMKQH